MKTTGKILLALGGIGAAVAAFLLFKKPAAANTTPPGTNLVVSLSNLDPLAKVWELMIFNKSYTKMLTTAPNGIPVTESAAFEVPADWDMPLKISLAVFKYTVPGVPTTLTQIMGVQSFDSNRAGYSPIFITALGNVVFKGS